MMTTFGLLFAVLAAYWVYNDTRRRGYDLGTIMLWSISTLAAFYIFLPLYLLIGRKSPVKSQRDDNIIDVEVVPVEETIQCPMCASNVKDDFKACPYCGFTLKPVCVCCGKELNREWRLCPYCQTAADVK